MNRQIAPGPRIGIYMVSITLATMLAACVSPGLLRPEKSINPGINDSFEDPDVQTFIGRFERDGRSVYQRRGEIIELLELKPGDDVADIGAGTGFFSMLMAEKVGPEGTVYAVEIAQNFVDHISETTRGKGIENVRAIHSTPRSTKLERNSIDAAFICDTYHHFEYPASTMASLRRALRPGGLLVVVDFERIEGVTGDFVLNMVRADKTAFKREIQAAGFELIEEVPFTDEHYILKFRKSG